MLDTDAGGAVSFRLARLARPARPACSGDAAGNWVRDRSYILAAHGFRAVVVAEAFRAAHLVTGGDGCRVWDGTVRFGVVAWADIDPHRISGSGVRKAHIR